MFKIIPLNKVGGWGGGVKGDYRGCSGDAGPGPDVEIVPQHQLATRGDGEVDTAGDTISCSPDVGHRNPV